MNGNGNGTVGLWQQGILWMVVLRSLALIGLLLVDGEALKTAPLASVRALVVAVAGWAPERSMAIVVYLAAVIPLLLSMCVFRSRPAQFLGLMPGQFLMILSATVTAQLIAAQHYADGVIRPWTFIAGDQMHGLVLPICYTATVLFYFGPSRESLRRLWIR